MTRTSPRAQRTRTDCRRGSRRSCFRSRAQGNEDRQLGPLTTGNRDSAGSVPKSPAQNATGPPVVPGSSADAQKLGAAGPGEGRPMPFRGDGRTKPMPAEGAGRNLPQGKGNTLGAGLASQREGSARRQPSRVTGPVDLPLAANRASVHGEQAALFGRVLVSPALLSLLC